MAKAPTTKKAPAKTSAKRASPVDFTPELGEQVCMHIAGGMGVAKIAKLKGMPHKSTIFRWLATQDKAPADGEEGEDGKKRPYEAFRQLYLQAGMFRANARVESIDEDLELLRSGKLDAQAARVIIDAKKWLAGKENQGRFGDAMTLRGDKSAPVHVQQRVVVDLSEDELKSIAAKGLIGGTG